MRYTQTHSSTLLDSSNNILQVALNWFNLLDFGHWKLYLTSRHHPQSFYRCLGNSVFDHLHRHTQVTTKRFFYRLFFHGSSHLTSNMFMQGNEVLSNDFWQCASIWRCMDIFRTQLILYRVIIVTYSGINAQLKRQILSVCSRNCPILKVKMASQYQNRCNKD